MLAFNPLYLLLIPPAVLAWYAQTEVRSVYSEFRAIPNKHGLTGLEAAKLLISYKGLNQLSLDRVRGTLTDHYDPQARSLRLSDEVAKGRSITSLGIVAHEVGHAVQDIEGYRLMRVRVGMASRLSQIGGLSSLVFLWGFLLGNPILMGLGVLMLAGMAVFALVTLPVERNASVRALAMLEETMLTEVEENKGIGKVLRAATLTYVANLGQRVAMFLLFVAVVSAAWRL